MPSAVLDSTVLISAFLARRGVSNELLRHARTGASLLYLSEEILTEAQGVLRAQAAYIVTRDKDLLLLHHHEGITMMTPEAFIAVVRTQETSRTEGNMET